jgi:hypothetical protein
LKEREREKVEENMRETPHFRERGGINFGFSRLPGNARPSLLYRYELLVNTSYRVTSQKTVTMKLFVIYRRDAVLQPVNHQFILDCQLH